MASPSTVRNTPAPRAQLSLVGTLIAGIVIGVGCSDDQATPLRNTSGGTSASAGQAGTSGLPGGSSSGGTATGAGNGGATTAGASGHAGSGGAVAGSAGSAGSGGTSAGTAGSSGSAGTAGSGGGVMCPAEGGAGGASEGGAGGAEDSALDPTGDQDTDGVANCLDRCPLDASKTRPGECGCGVVDADTDEDGTFDCKDECPGDKLKIAPGVCGCGSSDTANADDDAAVDCKDACPKDPDRTEAGACGCLPASLGASCLAHRYKFDGTGTVASDSIAGTSGDATVVGAQLSGSGTVVLLGASSDEYVKLPATLVSALGDSATFEAWVTWPGTGGDWQRIFDFGISDAGAGLRGTAAGAVFLTPRAGGSGLRAAITPSDYTQEDVAGIGTPLPTNVMTHLAVVVDGAGKTLSLYRDGVAQGTAATIRPQSRLSLLNDANNWLGRSQYQGDESLAGTFHEFRIYSRALTADEITATFSAGPDTLPP